MTLQEALISFKNQSLFSPTTEVCGLLGRKDNEYLARSLKNKHPDPKNFFSIDPLELLKFMRECEMVAVFHSHCSGDSQASDFDKATSENTLFPFLIYSLSEKKFSLFEPDGHLCDVTELRSSI